MVHIICGEKGKGKTKVILEKANEAIKTSGGNVVFLDKDSAHMYELNNKIRLINVKDFLVEDSGEFVGFICGIISQDHDLEAIFLDSFLKISFTDKENMKPVLDKIIQVADKYSVDVTLSLSVKSEDMPEEYRHNVLVSL
ncbi:MAG: twitching motility protein PilT [Catonella sp.]|uniref:twitching motility protein PilT n=1 Tax=Catonella sp. TaxID=2382125 RepID=UPI003FA0A1F4